MNLLRSINRIILIVLTIFLALSSIAGGVGLFTGLNSPPVKLLNDSPFRDYLIPGLALFAFAGGGALLAAILLVRKSGIANPFATAAGAIIMFFEFVEVLTIGSPPSASGRGAR